MSSLSFNISPVGVSFFANVSFNIFLSHIDILSISGILFNMDELVFIPKSTEMFDNSPRVFSTSFFASISVNLLGNNVSSKFLANLILLLM